jgi:hypothetical protein
MLSNELTAKIARATGEALKTVGGHEVINRVTVIRAYLQLIEIQPARSDHLLKLTAGIIDLAHVATQHQKTELARQLHTIATAIDRENTNSD